MIARLILAATLLCLQQAVAAELKSDKDITGTWVAKQTTPMGERESVFVFKVDAGKITGTASMQFGDQRIVDGKITGDNIEFVTVMDFFGEERRMTNMGKIVGDELRLTLPGPGPGGFGGPRGGRRGGPGGPDGFGGRGGPPPGFMAAGEPPPNLEPGGPGRGGRGGIPQEVVARRGTPSQPRRQQMNYSSLPKIKLPQLKDLPPNGLAQTPPMGFNTWNKFRTRINDKTIREIADAMVSSGMKDAGYTYINIDDGWEAGRDTNGVIQANTNFPNMKALADYVHSKGLKLGIYSSPGPRTCAGYEGSYAHEEQDAKTWAEWGIDYLKYDWCSASRVFTNASDMRLAYQKMGEALQATGRPIVYSLCQYGQRNVGEWGPKVGGNLWRTTGDISDRYQSMANIGFRQDALADYAGPGHWNDPDMLEIGNGGMNVNEYRTHFSLWAILAAPLIAGNDLRTMTPEIREILTNLEVIAVNQDKLGKQGRRGSKDGDKEIWTRPLAGGDVAIGLFNRGAEETEITLKWADVKLSTPPKVRDLWAHAERENSGDQFTTKVPGHGVVMLRVNQ